MKLKSVLDAGVELHDARKVSQVCVSLAALARSAAGTARSRTDWSHAVVSQRAALTKLMSSGVTALAAEASHFWNDGRLLVSWLRAVHLIATPKITAQLTPAIIRGCTPTALRCWTVGELEEVLSMCILKPEASRRLYAPLLRSVLHVLLTNSTPHGVPSSATAPSSLSMLGEPTSQSLPGMLGAHTDAPVLITRLSDSGLATLLLAVDTHFNSETRSTVMPTTEWLPTIDSLCAEFKARVTGGQPASPPAALPLTSTAALAAVHGGAQTPPAMTAAPDALDEVNADGDAWAPDAERVDVATPLPKPSPYLENLEGSTSLG
ncbi:hypothetical protein EON62_04710, partial [archaeon]